MMSNCSKNKVTKNDKICLVDATVVVTEWVEMNKEYDGNDAYY